MAPKWLTASLVSAIHAEAVAEFGGAAGVRDEALLESALARPRNLHAYDETASLFDLAAAYCAGLIRDHPFVDGNKRVGLLAADAFLALNGYRFAPEEVDVVTVILAVAAGEADEVLLAAWFSDYSTRRTP